MNILADQVFPASIQLSALPHLRLWRWSNEALTDVELVRLASRENFQAVAFLGTAALYSAELTAEAMNGGMALIGTAETDPVVAAGAIASNLNALARQIRPGASLVVYAREVRPFN